MALKLDNIEGTELADDYIRKSLPQSRWADTWDTVKSSFGKLVLINIMILLFFVPGIAVVVIRQLYIMAMGSTGPFNPSLAGSFQCTPNIAGLAQSYNLSADLMFYGLMFAACFIAAVGVSGGAYSIKKLVNTHGDFTFKGFFHGVKVCYLNTLFPLIVFMAFFYAAVLVGDWMKIVSATGGNKAGAITAYVFVIIAAVIAGLYCAWTLAVGASYKLKPVRLLRNSGVFMIGTVIQTVFFAAFALAPVWLLMIGGFIRWIGYACGIFLGFSFILVVWMSFTQWAFDKFVTPNLKAAQEDARASKSPKELAAEQEEEDKRIARELLAAGRSELIARPIMPVADKTVISPLGKTFTRKNLAEVGGDREKLYSEIKDYEALHEKDAVYVEYNKMFAEREKALQSPKDKKGKAKKKISADNLLK